MAQEYRKDFNDSLAFGRIAEGTIAQWLTQAKQYNVLPAYEIEIPSGKGPRLLTPSGELIVPDLYATRVNGQMVFVRRWIEAKHKERFTWHRKTQSWQTGIDLRHYTDYFKVREYTQTDVYILFLHRSTNPSKSDLEQDSPDACPVGLFYEELDYLGKHEDHRDSYTKSGHTYPMVYWNYQNLKLLATLEEVNAAILPKERIVV